MTLAAGCPRCAAPVVEDRSGATPAWGCTDHGAITPLWRPASATYDAFVDHLARAGEFPTYLPWPMSPGWSITDFGCVSDTDGSTAGTRPLPVARATVTTCAGTSDLDGVVEVIVVTEEAGIGLGRRVARTHHDDPGDEVGTGRPTVRVRLGSKTVPLWPVSTSTSDVEFDRSVFAGEAEGRWLWIVLRPASAALLLRDDWILADVARFGPHLLEMPFGGSPPAW